jgi:acyl-coenzyme A thioesterase PaaI-like protein
VPDQELCADHSRLESVYGPLAASIRRLIDVSIRSEADPAMVAAAKSKIDSATDDVSQTLRSGSFGVRRTPDGQNIAWGNVVVGARNPVAPPLVIHHEPDGLVWSEFVLGAAYEGPPEHVHGGVCALVLDHVLGATAHQPGRPAYTGTLTLRYRRRTPLGRPLRAQAHVERTEGAKTFAVGHLADEDGVTVEAEGVFIHPKQPLA